MRITAAVDLGSSSGRIVVGSFDGERLEVVPTYRFDNEMVEIDGQLTWDVDRIFVEIVNGLRELVTSGPSPQSVAVDTWGVDYVLLDNSSRQVGRTHAYRDGRTAAVRDELTHRLPGWRAFQATGVQPADINTVNQVYADLSADPTLSERVGQLLLLPDYFGYLLSGQRNWGWAIAGTTGLATAGRAEWSSAVFDALGIEESWVGPIRPGRRVLGPVLPDVGLGGGIQVIDAAGHDTACAVHATGQSPESVFISCGSWSVLGRSTPVPVVSREAFEGGFSNEVRVDGGNRIVKNITGLWILQECQRAWEDAGGAADITTLMSEATAADSLGVVFDPNDPVFAASGEMPAKILRYCRQYLGSTPQGRGQLVRLLLESLAVAYRDAVDDLVAVTSRPVETVHLIGGGSRSELLCQLTADATGLPVLAGPAEASAIGNVLAQLETTGAISGPEQLREVVSRSFPQRRYTPDSAVPHHLRAGTTG